MAIFYMRFEPTAKRRSKSNIVQFALSKERVNPGIAADKLSNQFGMFFQQVSRDVFEVPVNQRLPLSPPNARRLCLESQWHALQMNARNESTQDCGTGNDQSSINQAVTHIETTHFARAPHAPAA